MSADTILDNVQHFQTLDLAEKFMYGRGPRAVGFFSSVDSTEHTVFLTVAKQLAKQKETSPLLGRTTVGRGTKGCIIWPPDRRARLDGGSGGEGGPNHQIVWRRGVKRVVS